jgi:uncharacterized SAM-binding protein YcdF (DUF218 family)
MKELLRALILPPAGPLLLACVGLVLMRVRSARLRTAAFVLCAASIAALWLLGTPAVASRLLRFTATSPTLDSSAPVAAEAVVILAGGVLHYAPEYNDDAPTDITLRRLAYGARVARKSGLPVLVTGTADEARVMSQFLTADFGIPPRWVENGSLNTRDNAERSAAMLRDAGVRRVVLVTSASHMPRAAAEFRAQGLDVITAPATNFSLPSGALTQWIPQVGGLRDSRDAFYELLGDAVRRLR